MLTFYLYHLLAVLYTSVVLVDGTRCGSAMVLTA